MTRINRTRIVIVSTVALVVFLSVGENAFQVNCEQQSDVEKLLKNEGSLSGLIFIEGNQIKFLHPNENKTLELATSSAPAHPVFSCEKKILYWIDQLSKIRVSKLNGSQSTEVVYVDKTRTLSTTFALDFVTNKLYFGNNTLQTIDVIDLKTGNHGIIRSEKLSFIRSIEIDPYERYLFVFSGNQIVRMDLDGMNLHYILPRERTFRPEVITNPDSDHLQSGISKIALDLELKRVYVSKWNERDFSILSSSYDGTDEKLHLRNPSVAGFAILSNSIYWMEKNKGVIRRTNLSNATNNKIIYKGTAENVHSITSVNCNPTEQPQIVNPCSEQNGGCQHLCVLSRSSENNYRCFCNMGYELANDGKSCILPTKFFAFAQKSFIRGVKWRDDIKQHIDVLNPSQHTEFAGHHPPGHYPMFDVDVEERVFYQSFTGSNNTYSTNIDNRKKIIFQKDSSAIRALSLTFDWASKNLYYFDITYSQRHSCETASALKVLNTKNTKHHKILAEYGFPWAHGLVIHPNRGYVYFLYGRGVVRIHTDGSNPTKLFDYRRKIQCFAIDYAEDKFYWSEQEHIDGDDAVVYHSNLHGENITQVEAHFQAPLSYFNMAIQRDWIYFTITLGLHRVPKRGGESEQITSTGDTGELRMFDRSIQTTRTDHPCVAGKESSCEKFCFAVPSAEKVDILKRVCGCLYGEKLANDGRSCIDNSKEEPPLKACRWTKYTW